VVDSVPVPHVAPPPEFSFLIAELPGRTLGGSNPNAQFTGRCIPMEAPGGFRILFSVPDLSPSFCDEISRSVPTAVF